MHRKNNYFLFFKTADITKFISENYKLILIVLVFLMGIVVSMICFDYVKSSENVIIQIISKQYEIKETQSVKSCFLNNLTMFSIYLSSAFLCGVCALGIPVIPILPFLYGMNVGYQVTYLYTTYGAKGVGYTALMVVPLSVIFAMIITFASNEALNMSAEIFTCVQDNKKAKIDLLVYVKRFAVFLVLTIAFTALFSFINTGLAKIITL